MQIPHLLRIHQIANRLSLWAIVFLSANMATAQAYFVSQDNAAYDVQFDSPTDITITDNDTEEIPIGFSFTFFGNPYTTCHLSENGFLQFGATPEGGCCAGQFLPSQNNPDNLIAAAWMDADAAYCCFQGDNYSVFQYETIGSAPNRIFLITLSMEENCSAYYSGQIKLFETSDIIEIHTSQWADASEPCSNVTQGIENLDGTVAFFLAGRNANTTWSVPCCDDVVRFTPSYSMPQNDAGIEYIFNQPACEGTQSVEVLVTNYGAISLSSVVVDWTWDSVPQDSLLVEFNPPILNGQSALVEIGEQVFNSGEQYDITAWTSLPNEVEDDDPSNDLLSSVIETGISGTYTIGGSSPDFTSFAAAISFLTANDVCDTVRMMVRPGTYTEQLTLPWIPGAYASQVIFRAENGDSTSVILQFDPTTTNRHVVRFNNAAGITWEHMTINALGTDFGRVFQFDLNSFNNTIQHCAINGINTSSTSNAFSCIYADNSYSDNLIRHNTIKNGSYGIQHTSSSNYKESFEVRSNRIENFSNMGLQFPNVSGLQVHGNTIISTKNNVVGIEVAGENDALEISGNKIELSSGWIGIKLDECTPAGGARANVSNNMVYINHATTEVYAIYCFYTERTNIFFNTAKVSGPNIENAAFQLYESFQDSVFNNLFTSFGGGMAFYIGEVNQTVMDYNGYYHTGPILGTFEFGSYILDHLEEWREVIGFDLNSFLYPPYFLTETNLHLGNSYLNGKASPVVSTLYDFDGDIRDGTNPDPGADEFDPASLDASIAAMLSPVDTCETLQDIEVVLINLGTDTLTDAVLNWTLNGDAQTPFNFSGELLPEGDTAHVTLQALAMFEDQPDTLVFQADQLNGEDDMFMANDELSKIYSLPLNGTYTIGGSNPDFPSITTALSALQQFAICGPVTFLIRNGIYATQFSIGPISGSSSINTITFSSENQDSSLVTIQFNSTISANYLVQLDGAQHVRFTHLGFKTINTTYANIFYMKDGAADIEIDHCYLEGRSPTISSGSSYSFYTNEAFGGDVNIHHNYFLNGTRAIYIQGNVTPTARQDSIQITGNYFLNQRAGAIYGQNLRDVSIDRNRMISNTTATYTGLQISNCHGDNSVAFNKVNLTGTGDGIAITGQNSQSDLPGLCEAYNNMVSVVSGSAFSLSSNRRLNFIFNTGYTAGTTASSHHAIKLSGGDSITVKNNIAVANAGRAYNESFFIPVVHADYNNFFTNGIELAYRANIGYANLAAWQSGTNLDLNSLSVNPLFVSSGDLHILESSLNGMATPFAGILTDIDDQIRNTLLPDIGADEIGTEPGDVGILGALPKMPFARGLQDVKVIVRNYGSDTLYTAVISWKLNGIPQPDYYYSSELPSLGEDTVVLGALDFDLSTAYQMTIWTTLPNQLPDSNPFNDTLTQTAIYPAVSGTITIGSSGEVLTIAGAITAMNLGGILDSVQFAILPGTYHESISLNAASFLLCGAQVVFTSSTGNAADVVWDNLGTGTHTVIFNGADGIEFRHLTIKTVINAFNAILFQNASTCNTITHCVLEGVTTTSTANTYAVLRGVSTSSSNYNHNNTIQYNTISKGSFNIHWDGFTGTTGLLVKNNTLQNAYNMGLLLYRLKAPQASRNTIKTTSAIAVFTGIYCEACSENASITANQVLLHGKRSTGIYYYISNGTALLPARIANNFVIVGQGASSYGLYTNNSSYVNVYHNTIRISGGDNTGTNILRNLGGNISYLNNILDNQANGKTMQFNGTGTPLTTNYNTHYTEGTNLINYLGTNYTTLAAWKATGRDINSQHIEPLYEESAPLGYEILNSEMNGSATPGTNTPDDLEGSPRNALTPDIGCDEFDLFTHDVGISGITYPHLPYPEGLNTVYIKFINNGQDTLTSMEVNWEVDSVLQPTYLWTGLLPSAGTYDSLDIGEFNFAPNQYHQIKVWVSEPNEMQDELAFNDTLTVDSLYPALHGSYTIGGVDPDFETITEAVAELNKGGASSPVTFNIRTGTYLDTILIKDFPGSDCDRPVIFQSESGDREDVLITNLGFNAHTVVLNGADGVIFQNLRITSVNPAYRHVVSYYNGAHCNQFINNAIIGFEGTSTASSAAVIYSVAGLDTQNVFSGNLIQYGSYGFYIFGATTGIAGTIIEGNTFDQPYSTGVYAKWEYNIVVDHNVFTAEDNDMTGVVLYLCHHFESVSNNIFDLPDGGYGLYIEDCDNLVSAPGLMANNFISIGGTNIARGIYITGSSYHTILNNNFHITTTHTGLSIGVPLYLNSCPSLKIYNNNLSNTGVGYGIYATNNTSFQSDYNNFYISGSNFGYWDGSSRITLSDWQAATGQDLNALEINPQYMSDTDLHVSNILLNGAGLFQPLVLHDIDGESRLNPPDIGADEFDPSIANDAGVFMAIGPHAPFAAGVQPIEIALKNFGADTLTSVNIRWLVNGIEQTPYIWTGSLLSAQCDTVTIGTYAFPEYTGHELIYWTESPNAIPDSTSVNDTLLISNLYPALSGMYTVGGVLPDFNLFSQLQTALDFGGIAEDVTFNIRNGTYASQLLVQNFPRVSSAHTVSFSAESGDSSLVILTRNFTASDANNYTVRLKNAHGILFENITLASTKGHVVEIADGSSNIEIKHCHITGVDLLHNYSGYNLIYSGTTTEDSIFIRHNRFEYGYQGISMIGSSGDREAHHVVEFNHFYNQYSRAIYSRYSQNLRVNNNSILSTTKAPDGIDVSYTFGNVDISNNDIRLMSGGTYGISLYASEGTALQPITLNNNYILSRNSSSSTYGLAQENCKYIHYNYNTVRLENVGTNSISFVDEGSYHYIHIQNCIFSNESGGKAMSTPWTPFYSSNTFDHCNLYGTGPVLVYCFVDYVDLPALQVATGHNMLGMSVESLFNDDGPDVLQAALDSTALPISGITTDIYGAPRNGSAPDIGAKEFTLLAHDVGPKLLSAPATYCGFSSMEQVTIRLQNFGSSTETGFNVAYSMNGAAWVVENVGSLMIEPGSTLDYTFSASEDLSIPGEYTFSLYSSLPADLHSSNDTMWNITMEHIPELIASATNLIPADETIDLNSTVSLSWSPAQHATLYDIYLWPSANSEPITPQIANISQINTNYQNLSYGVTYTWKVVAKNVCNQQVASNTQEFTIRHLPDLQIDTILAPLVVFSGQNIELEWIVKNYGQGGTQSTIWSDAVYLSTDATLNLSLDTYLGAIQNLTALDSGEAYLHTIILPIPHGYAGYYYVFVTSDRYSTLLETNNNNNATRTLTQIEIQPSPLPDLKVEMIAAPLSTFSGQTVTLQYEVKNIGLAPTTTGVWHDRVIFNADPENYAGGTVIGTFLHQGALEQDSSYSRTVSVPIPPSTFGDRYIYVVTDWFDVIFESAAELNNVGRSDTIEVILLPPPDLITTEINIADTLHNNQIVPMNYVFENQGGTTITTATWLDRIYFSQSPIYNTNFLINAGTKSLYGPLMPYEPQISSTGLLTPLSATGEYFLYIVSDINNLVFEHVYENNNVKRTTNSFLIVNPDLTPEALSHADTAISGSFIPFSWGLINQGPGHLINRNFYQNIYISTQAVFDAETATQLTSLYATVPMLRAGDTLQYQTYVTLPDGWIGNAYFHVVSNTTNIVFENGNTANNVSEGSLIFLEPTPYPDIYARQIQVPDTATAGESFIVTYEDYNGGTEDIGVSSTDSIFMSFNPVWVPELSTPMSKITGVDPLMIQDSQSLQFQILLPLNQTSNQYYLYIKSDATHVIYEGDGESNNIQRSDTFFVNPPKPLDLKLTNVAYIPDTVWSGSLANVYISTHNIGQRHVSSPSWKHATYLSVDSILQPDLDYRLGQKDMSMRFLASGSSRLDTVTGAIPASFSGDYYIIGRTDDLLAMMDIDYSNNVEPVRSLSAARKVHIKRTPSPDLIIHNVTAQETAFSGQPFPLTIEVRNIGTGIAGSHQIKIYLSADQQIGYGDILLKNHLVSTLLDTASSQFIDFSLTPPITSFGNYYLILQVDASNQQYEYLGENNNTQFRTMTIVLPPPSDLVVQSITLPDTAYAGDTASITWQTQNIGTNPAVGVFREIIYFSTDTLLDVTDRVFGILDNNQYINPGSSVFRSFNGPLNGLSNLDYYALVQTDARNNLPEVSEENNLDHSESKIHITIEPLLLDSLTPGILANGSEKYFKLEIPFGAEGENLQISLTGDSLALYNEMYLKYGEVPTPADFDANHLFAFEPDQELIFEDIQGGTYYIMIRGYTPVDSQQQIHILARIIDFELLAVKPGKLKRGAQTTIELFGTQMDSLRNVYIVRDSTIRIHADTVYSINSSRAYATFTIDSLPFYNLEEIPLGLYDVQAERWDGKLAELTQCVEITDTGSEADLQFVMEYPTGLSTFNRPIKITIYFQNSGDADLVGESFLFEAPWGNIVAKTYEELRTVAEENTLIIPIQGAFGPPGILSPKAINIVEVFAYSRPHPTFVLTPINN